MEDRSYDPNDKKEESDDPTKRFMQKGESFIQYLLRKRESDMAESLEADDDDEETEESGVSPKRRSKLFQGIFRNMVSKQPIESGTKSASIQGPETGFALSGSEARDATKPRAETAPLLVPGQAETPERVTSPAESPPDDIQAASTSPEVPTEDARRETTPPDEDEPNPRTTDGRNATVSYASEVTQSANTPRTEKETVIERSVGNALPVVLVGAEYFARKRADRKLDQKFTKQGSDLTKEVSRGESARQELNRLVEQNRTEVEALKQKRDNLPVQQAVKVPEAPAPERQAPAYQERYRQTETNLQAKTEAYDYNRQPNSPEVQAQLSRERAEKLARSLETVQERSHEIKDDHTATSTATTIGALIADSTAAQSLLLKQASSHEPNAATGLQVATEEQASKLYRQAIQSGFILAVVIIILGLLAYLVLQ